LLLAFSLPTPGDDAIPMPPSKLGETHSLLSLDLPDHIFLSSVDEVLKALHPGFFCHGWPYSAYRKFEIETLELGLEKVLQVTSASLMSLLTHTEVGAVRMPTARSAQLPRAADARFSHAAKTGASCNRTHGVGCVFTIVRRSARGTRTGLRRTSASRCV
jgi:hypothetical protein